MLIIWPPSEVIESVVDLMSESVLYLLDLLLIVTPSELALSIGFLNITIVPPDTPSKNTV